MKLGTVNSEYHRRDGGCVVTSPLVALVRPPKYVLAGYGTP